MKNDELSGKKEVSEKLTNLGGSELRTPEFSAKSDDLIGRNYSSALFLD